LLEEAVQQLQQFRAHSQTMFSGFLGEALLAEGQIDRAHELATRGLAGGEGFAYATAIARRLLGRVAQARGRLAEAEDHLTEALRAFSAIPARYEVARTQLLLGELAHARGTRDAASAHLQEAYALFTALRVPHFTEYTAKLANQLGIELAREVA
jgi:tetratricopeptide (TPR) repeat protein